MRELLNLEVNLVSGAGVVKDSEKGQVVQTAINILKKIPATKGGATFLDVYYDINDELWTHTYNQVMEGINNMFKRD